MRVEPKDVDSRHSRHQAGWSPVSTAEGDDAQYIRESKYIRSPLDERRLNYYGSIVDSRHERSKGAKEKPTVIQRVIYDCLKL